jgi:hypothetical protein
MTSPVMFLIYYLRPISLKERKKMRADRLLSIVLLLQAHHQMSSRVLAERLEVS